MERPPSPHRAGQNHAYSCHRRAGLSSGLKGIVVLPDRPSARLGLPPPGTTTTAAITVTAAMASPSPPSPPSQAGHHGPRGGAGQVATNRSGEAAAVRCLLVIYVSFLPPAATFAWLNGFV